jgi:hypothetical protein
VRLGLLADIHEAIEPLRAAVSELRARRVDAFVMLGDVLDHGERADETVALLKELPGVGVWGNHDFGLCGEVDDTARTRYSPDVLEYFGRLRSSVVVEGTLFQHIDPHLDPESFTDLWKFPTSAERIAGLARCPHRRALVGHHHSWGVFTTERRLSWEGELPFHYETDGRYLTLVHAVVAGWCALLDTDRGMLEPLRVV